MKSALFACTLASATMPLMATGIVPELSNITMRQDSKRKVVINYTLANAPAVVTVDIQTNVSEDAWASIGGEHVQSFSPNSAVWKRIETDGTYEMTWNPEKDWPGHAVADGQCRAVVTAWAPENTPDYMVVDIAEGASPNTQRYYPAAEFVPGGVLANEAYRKTALLMRKITAKDITWTMGSVAESSRQENEATHLVTLTNNYYIGVFEITQTQWSLIATRNRDPSYYNTHASGKLMRPVERVSYNEIRNNTGNDPGMPVEVQSAYNWPNPPYGNSFLGVLRARTGLDFDLPTEAEWEFACRAGHGEGLWGEGSAYRDSEYDSNLLGLGRYYANGGLVNANPNGSLPGRTCDVDSATATAGSYRPNDFGLYDMHGNVWEWCLDWYEADISAHGGLVNINPANAGQTRGGNTPYERVQRGGCYADRAQHCRSARRQGNAARQMESKWGFRVACRAGLE